ncbi:DnaD domain protein [Paenibacillus sp. 481]|uniref:DnaD domain protein n=1 Tax=Paenibacillus sp. 481 TaxID=2835869 RepID=UPI001E597DFF|nr:DnaD domain protein [Paenibacillus sp. 481]UHA74585.1 DnaD domain protein [Paenibacillus sp. 481]
MRMSNMLHFTEHHRYVTYREFSLSELDNKMLSHVYQPMVGAFAIGLYHLLSQHVPADQVGYSVVDSQRRLFLLLGLEPSEKGRAYFIEQSSKLEAVGLLQTSRLLMPDADDYMFEYELQQPLSPNDFFQTQHLTLLLRDKVGKYAVLSLREQFGTKEPFDCRQAEVQRENISIPFYELFRLNTHVIDYELEQALQEVAPSRSSSNSAENGTDTATDLNYADIITRFPKQSFNRSFVEKLRYDRESMGIINHVVRKFDLTLQETCRLLDEDGVFESDGRIILDELQHRAHLHFRQNKRRSEWREREQSKMSNAQEARSAQPAATPEHEQEQEVAVQMEFYVEVPTQFQSKCDVHQYNMMLRNTPYTRLLERFFPGAVPDSFLDMFTKMDLNYKLPDEVINVLIHYLMTMLAEGSEQRLNRNFVEAIVTNMLAKQVKTYEQAVLYIRQQGQQTQQLQAKDGQGTRSASNGQARNRGRYGNKPAKPVIPVVQPKQTPGGKTLSQADLDRALELAKRLDGGSR